MTRRILITGASIADNTAAWWLGRFGFDVTVVESAPAFRDGGQNIDVRGLGREVLRRMELERAALDNGTGEEGTAWVDGDAAWCATLIAVFGTTLAITGADICWPRNYAARQTWLRPTRRRMVEEAQGVPKIGPHLMNPHSRLGISLLHGALKLASAPAVRTVAGSLFARKGRTPDLSRYADNAA